MGQTQSKLLLPRVALTQKPSAKFKCEILVSGFSLSVLVSGFSLIGCCKNAPGFFASLVCFVAVTVDALGARRARYREVGVRLGRGFPDRALSEASEGFLEA
jgi:hypothetical protein